MSEQPGQRRSEDLTDLTTEGLLTDHPEVLAKKLTSAELTVIARGLATEAEEIQGPITELELALEIKKAIHHSLQARMHTYLEAAEIARANESGE